MYKNPFNYIGAKYKLLPQILPLFPKNIGTFVDLFGGSGEVSFNVDAEQIIYNEKCKQLVNIFNNMDDDFLADVESVIKKWGLTKTSKDEFLALREYYNDNLIRMSPRENAAILYCLMVHAFNYQIAFNSKGEYNMPSGAGRSYFSPQLKTKLTDYITRKGEMDIQFLDKDFLNVSVSNIGGDDTFVYADPPYLITVGAYERDYFCKWSETYERALLDYLDDLSDKGYKFALSNVMEHKGKSNEILKDWANKYHVHHLNIDYKNCNYQTKVKTANSSDEVLITNY
ncbi:MAG: Dam family site-specific DNA-(adenine-N6)-methyltransferase [Lachnospiraceae bacterium]|nr:Dam family site-specific DNA-(adenine-N6)-methyltransferase [Ruminococcus sp.]MCM1277222.1 Dam family site-specific DNA-(adenine-N6)-methyltransferase [Lachnospiraceae bacterium]